MFVNSKLSSVLIFIAYSIPGWALGGVLLVLFGGGSFFDVFPLGGFRSPSEIWDTLTPFQKIIDQIHHMIFPLRKFEMCHQKTIV